MAGLGKEYNEQTSGERKIGSDQDQIRISYREERQAHAEETKAAWPEMCFYSASFPNYTAPAPHLYCT
jgi:hypothetical protein